ncbi:MAG: histidine kinase dimerization/phospho-acceptor domain-containing protein [Suipraeoptans sp.]
MKKWYRSNVTKVVLVVLTIITSVVAMSGVAWYLQNLPSMSEIMLKERPEKYYDSKAFGEDLENSTHRILRGVVGFEMNTLKGGEFDDDTLVDIKQYNDNGTISGENESGFAYTLGELKKWNNSIEYEYQDNYLSNDNNIVVCRKSDGSYKYFRYLDFSKEIFKDDLSINLDDEESSNWDDDKLVSYLQEHENNPIINKNNEVVYNSCWFYDGMSIAENAKPDGVDSILEIANENEEWNGKLSNMFTMLGNVVSSIGSNADAYNSIMKTYQEGDTNLHYILADTKNKVLYTNNSSYTSYDKLDSYIDEMKKNKYIMTSERVSDFESNVESASAKDWTNTVLEAANNNSDFIYIISVDTSFPIEDTFAINAKTYDNYVTNANSYQKIVLVSISVFLICLIWLCMIAGRRMQDNELHLTVIDKIKTELAAVIHVTVIVLLGVALVGGTMHLASTEENEILIAIIPLGALLTAACLIALLSLVRMIKAGILWSNSLLKIVVNTISGLFRNIGTLWKTILVFATIVIIHWIGFSNSSGFGIFLALITEVAAFIYLIRTALGRLAIHKGIKEIANGNLNYKITSKHLKGEQLEIARRVNTIGEGLGKAVDESLRSERMKTDLITNVSHDIKTPLTSIINYVGLLKQEDFKDPKIIKYLDILDDKAQRLKTLTEDVVEASKVSSGNIKLELVNINFVEMIQQTSGEFEEKLAQRKLHEVLTLPQQEVIIRADSKRTWRVLENIYNNVSKYAMPGTRVYSELKVENGNALFYLKNVSEEELNITPDELTERFIRGDESRTKEGSGLGLSIAKSLTELQGGKFKLFVDGDLFKVEIKFPIVN